jgi:hypothetical protein
MFLWQKRILFDKCPVKPESNKTALQCHFVTEVILEISKRSDVPVANYPTEQCEVSHKADLSYLKLIKNFRKINTIS